MKLEAIETFLSLAETLSFSKTAELLQTSQPNVSRQLKQIESQTGMTLFIRTQRRVALSPEGVDLQKKLQAPFKEIQQTLILKEGRNKRSLLKIGSFAEIGQNIVVPKLFEFSKHNSQKIQFHVDLSETDALINGLKQGEFNFAFLYTDPNDESLRCYEFIRERIVIITSSINPMVIKNEEKGPPLQFVGYQSSDGLLRHFISKHIPKAKKRVATEFVVNSHRSMIEWVHYSSGYAVMPYESVKNELKEGRIRIATQTEWESPLYFVYPEKGYFSEAETAFTKWILKQKK